MQILPELGAAVANRRKNLGLKQGEVAAMSGVSQEVLSRFERGKVAEFGSRKLLAVLGVLGMEIQFVPFVPAGSLDDLRVERGGGS